jgi:hypothetical protein
LLQQVRCRNFQFGREFGNGHQSHAPSLTFLQQTNGRERP